MLRDAALVVAGVCIALQVQTLLRVCQKRETSLPKEDKPVGHANVAEIANTADPRARGDIATTRVDKRLTYLEKDPRSSGLLVLMRHGQSVWNRKPARPDFVWRYAGTVDVPLSEVGMQEALEAGVALQHIPLDLVFCSEMDRARNTVSLALSVHESGKTPIVVHSSPLAAPEFNDLVEPNPTQFVLPVYVSAALNERHFGSLQGVPSTSHPPHISAIVRNEYRIKFPGPNGESCADVEARVLPYFREYILPQLASGKNVLVSTHGFVIRTLIKVLEGLDDEEYLAQMNVEKVKPEACRLLAPTGVPLMYAFEHGDCAGGRLVPVVDENRRARAKSIARSQSKDSLH
ncbi:hypothetical protein H310_07558 [Aphanomyces invadans]|uniref:phosphoglycerate mutase (2,3-diphosphoglycerate-dependent) n=1 Tax=Aphanomyces invadans TaxID=157072 RepID=A0A024U2L9_9STRA|nr:hypothetical protein H310_07558 [Aphanomyces invadans]ETW00152.1 hypothetical protein H310_07558 [Aphanomyces invadans]|eukprot:XP_008871177.1 hypothetical protein H310_07558 [Aphanomyces invadans]